MSFDAATIEMLKVGIWETLFMTFTLFLFCLFNWRTVRNYTDRNGSGWDFSCPLVSKNFRG